MENNIFDISSYNGTFFLYITQFLKVELHLRKWLKPLFTSAALKHFPMGPQSEACYFWILHKCTNKMVYNLFGHKFIHRNI